MKGAIEHDGVAQRALLAGDATAAREAFAEASELYRRSWEGAPPGSYGRLVGMLKSAVLAGEGREQADFVKAALTDAPTDSPTAAYALALAALVEEDDASARELAQRMHGGSEAFERTARAIGALAGHDRDAYASALTEIVRDFEQRISHLTGVAIADTALLLQWLADRRGIEVEVDSPVLPAPSYPRESQR
jgi:hypothetical protein